MGFLQGKATGLIHSAWFLNIYVFFIWINVNNNVIFFHKILWNVKAKYFKSVSYITCVSLAACDMTFHFTAVTVVRLSVRTILLSCTAASSSSSISSATYPSSSIWNLFKQTHVGANQGFNLWTCRISMNIVFCKVL